MSQVVWNKRNKTLFSLVAIIGVLFVGWLGFTILDALP